MNKLNLIAVCFLTLFLGACATTNNGKVDVLTSVENTLPYVKPAVVLACTVVLDQAVSGNDRIEKAKMINHVATIVEGLTVGTAPTPAQLQKALNDYLPEEKTHWVNYVSVIKDIYAQQFARLDGNTALAIKVLNAIASGCKDATASYVE
jgi:pantothenate kinase-related protein Tda10